MFNDKYLQLESGKAPRLIPKGRYTVVGKLENAGHVPRKTDIRPSLIFDEVSKHTTEPAVFTTRDPRNPTGISPTAKGIQKFDNDNPQWDVSIMRHVKKHLLQKIASQEHTYYGPRRILTLDEAINGIPSSDGYYVAPVDMRTSAGFPYTKMRPPRSIGKEWLFELVGARPDGSPIYKAGKQLQEDIDYLIENIKKYKIVRNYFTDELKDERRPLEKIQEVKTRVFNTHNVAWQLVSKMYLGSYAAMLTHLRFKIHSSIGINPHGPEVSEVADILNQIGPYKLDLDVEKWDGTYDLITGEMCVEMAYDWLSQFEEIDRWEFKTAASSFIINRIHVCGDTVYMAFVGMPSGCFVTAIFNTNGHMLRHFSVMMEICLDKKQIKLCQLTEMDKHHYATFLGDDCIAAFSDAFAWMKVSDITAQWKKHGITVQPPSKITGETVDEFKPLEECTYLKCSFTRNADHPRFWHMALKKEVILELTNWIRTGGDPYERLESNLSDVARFSLGHGREYSENVIKRIRDAFRKRELPQPMIPSYDELMIEWFSNHGLPVFGI